MARIRSIKPEFWTSEQVMECSPLARLLFIGLWNFADDGGNHPDSAKTLKAEVFPSDDMTTGQVAELLFELVDSGLLTPYEADGRAYLHITGWHHQKIDRPTFKHPAPGESSPSPRRVLAEPSPPEGKGEERKKSTATLPRAGDDESQIPPTAEAKPAKPAKPAPPLPDWIPRDVWAAYVEMRKTIRAPLTAHAVALTVSQLAQFREQGHDPAAVLNQSIAHAWRGVFPVKSLPLPGVPTPDRFAGAE